MRNSLRRFLPPPIFSGDPEKTRRVMILHYASILLVLFSLALFAINLFFGSQDEAAVNWVLSVVVLTQLAVQWLIRSGKEVAAGYVMLALGWGSVTMMAQNVDGIRDVAMLGYVAIILGAGYLLGWKTAILFTSICIAAIWWLASLQLKGVIIPNLSAHPYRTALDLSVIFVVIFMIAYVILRTLTQAITNAQHELDERNRIEAELEKAIVQLSHEIADRKHAQAELKEQAITDFLTGLFNRRYFFEIAQKEFAKAIRYDRFLSIIIFDLDLFKDINDTYGHEVGDQALIQIGDLLRSSIRSVDVSARYGGEEFVVLLPEMDCVKAIVAAERLRKEVENNPIQVGDDLVHLTISSGVAGKCGTYNVESVDQLISRADQALYKAKRAGRNRVVCYQKGDMRDMSV